MDSNSSKEDGQLARSTREGAHITAHWGNECQSRMRLVTPARMAVIERRGVMRVGDDDGEKL
jgi:hypothetical protein